MFIKFRGFLHMQSINIKQTCEHSPISSYKISQKYKLKVKHFDVIISNKNNYDNVIK